MKILTLEQQRERINNINHAEQTNRAYLRRHRIREYLPGQATYNLGDYPARFSIEPTEYDYNMLKDMAERGVELIQLHEEWNDAIRRFGADKFSSFDPKGLQKFVDLCHSFGIKVIAYASSGYFNEPDPDFQEEFANSVAYCINGMHFKYRACSHGSAEWRNYLLPRTFAVLDKYGFDGLYNDSGIAADMRAKGKSMEICNPEVEDLLGMIYTEVKKRGGIYKLHCSGNNPAPAIDRVYDYLWIGESVGVDGIGAGKNFPDYVVPCQDKVRINWDNPDYYFAKVIPFMQFPLLTTRGRPLMGKRIGEDIPYYGNTEEKLGNEYAFNKRVGEYMKEHPDGPFVYSLWSAIPDDPLEYDRWSQYLALYKPMVEENSLAYIELRDCGDILSPLPQDVYASMFVNEKMYLAVSNLTDKAYMLVLKDNWRDRVTGKVSNSFTIEPGKISFLVKE